MKRPKQHTPSVQSPEIITPLKVRQRKLAQAVLAGNKTGADIGRELMPHVENPAQAVYNRLQDKGVQEAIRQEVEKTDYDKRDIRRIISLVLQSAETNARDGKLTSSQAKVLEIASRTEAMLTDKQEVAQTFRALDKAKDMSTDELMDILMERLRADGTGIAPEGQKIK